VIRGLVHAIAYVLLTIVGFAWILWPEALP